MDFGIREFFLENFAGDLEYHPRRAAVYLVLAIGAGCYWILSPPAMKYTTVPLVFGLGSLTLLGKGVFLLRPSSEGLGLSQTEVTRPAKSAKRKPPVAFPVQLGQIVQDFGTGGLLLWPLGNIGKEIPLTGFTTTELRVFAVGASLFGLGWAFRRFMRRDDAWSSRR